MTLRGKVFTDCGDASRYRQGTLRFVHNTALSERPGNTTLVRLSAAGHALHVENSVLASDGNLAILDANGDAVVEHTWRRTGWVASHQGGGFVGSLTSGAGLLTGADPGFVDRAGRDLTLDADSPALDVAGPVDAPGVVVDEQPTDDLQGAPRPDDGAPDLGAYEH